MKKTTHQALLVALVLDPSTYSRNRFFTMYTDNEIRRIRRRATMVRSVVRYLVEHPKDIQVNMLESIEPGVVRFEYENARLGYRRMLMLETLEIALIYYCIRNNPVRDKMPPPTIHMDVTMMIESALMHLSSTMTSVESMEEFASEQKIGVRN